MSEESDLNYGAWIRRMRRSRGLSIETVSKTTRIDSRYLKALEAGNIDLLPEPYMRAYLKTYAEYLGMDVDEIQRRFEEFLKERISSMEILRGLSHHREGRRTRTRAGRIPADYSCNEPVIPAPSEERKWRISPRLIALTGVFLLITAVVIIIMILIGRDNRPGADSGHDLVQAETVGSVRNMDESAGEVDSSIRTDDVPVSASPPAVIDSVADNLFVAVALEETWLQAVADGDTVVSRLVSEGIGVEVPFNDTLEVKLGKNLGMRLLLNGEEITDLGPPGRILTLLLTSKGIIARRITLPPELIPDILNVPPGL